MKQALIVIVAIIAIVAIGFISIGNGLVSKQENVKTEYANLDAALQRRADLIPNLVSTVKGFMEHEDEIIDKITEARKSVKNAKTIDEAQEANDELTSALNGLTVIVENYPELKSSENFLALQDELAGTENRINVARRDYNDAVKTYNTAIKKFPGSIVAGMKGYESEKYFEASETAKEVPSVEF